MTKTTEAPTAETAPRKPDGILTTRIENQTFIIEVYFKHDSADTFQDKLLKVILAEKNDGNDETQERLIQKKE
jgi:hypothetical protein